MNETAWKTTKLPLYLWRKAKHASIESGKLLQDIVHDGVAAEVARLQGGQKSRMSKQGPAKARAN